MSASAAAQPDRSLAGALITDCSRSCHLGDGLRSRCLVFSNPGRPFSPSNGRHVDRVLLTEMGCLGLLAFFGLLLRLALLGNRLWQADRDARADRVLALSLPGVAGLTVAGALYAGVLEVVRGHSIVFWLVVGLALSAAYELGVVRVIRPVRSRSR
jgi:hypothetical protein